MIIYYSYQQNNNIIPQNKQIFSSKKISIIITSVSRT